MDWICADAAVWGRDWLVGSWLKDNGTLSWADCSIFGKTFEAPMTRPQFEVPSLIGRFRRHAHRCAKTGRQYSPGCSPPPRFYLAAQTKFHEIAAPIPQLPQHSCIKPRYVCMPKLAHFGNHFLPLMVDYDMPILVWFQNWHKMHSVFYRVTHVPYLLIMAQSTMYTDVGRIWHTKFELKCFLPTMVYSDMPSLDEMDLNQCW